MHAIEPKKSSWWGSSLKLQDELAALRDRTEALSAQPDGESRRKDGCPGLFGGQLLRSQPVEEPGNAIEHVAHLGRVGVR